MRNIFFNYFESVFSLESFLVEINCKMSTKAEEEQLKHVLKKLTTILITFDFNFNG